MLCFKYTPALAITHTDSCLRFVGLSREGIGVVLRAACTFTRAARFRRSLCGFARKVVLTTVRIFSAIPAYLCDLCVKCNDAKYLAQRSQRYAGIAETLSNSDKDYFRYFSGKASLCVYAELAIFFRKLSGRMSVQTSLMYS